MMVRMKAVALLLVLAFGTLQGVAVTVCPCGSLCESKNTCPDETRHASPDDCCSRTRAGTSEENQAPEVCFHLEPQTELDSPAVDNVVLSTLSLGLLEVPSPTLHPAEVAVFGEIVGLAPPGRSRPLFLLHSSLLL